MIEDFYGTINRPAVVFFKNSVIPINTTSSCSVGPSELCCHMLALLLFLKQFIESKGKILRVKLNL